MNIQTSDGCQRGHNDNFCSAQQVVVSTLYLVDDAIVATVIAQCFGPHILNAKARQVVGRNGLQSTEKVHQELCDNTPIENTV